MAVNILHTDGRFYTETEYGEAELLYKVLEGNIMSIHHTFVPEQARGMGLAAELASEAFKFAREMGYKVRPDCPYILYFVEKHPELKSQTLPADQPSGESCDIR